MDKAQLLTLLTTEHERFAVLLDHIDPGVQAAAEVHAGWTVKDVLAHVAAWQAELVLGLATIRQGRTPRYASITAAEIDKLNARWHAENRDRSLERVRADFHGVHKQLLRQLDGFTDDDLFRRGRYRWLGDRTLAEWLADYSHAHEAEHAADIEARLSAGAR